MQPARTRITIVMNSCRINPGMPVPQLGLQHDLVKVFFSGRVPGGMRMSLGPSNDALLRLPRHVRPSEAVEAAATGGGGSAKVVARRNVFRQPTHKQPVVANGVSA